MKRFIVLLLLFPSMLFGATVYVDLTLEADCDGSSTHYDPTTRACVAGAGAKAWNTLQDAIYGAAGTPGAAAGDTIYLRGGTYTEGYGPITSGHGTAMHVSTSLNGTAWTAGNFTTIASYPGEWAIIDASSQTTYLFAIGYGGQSWNTGSGALAYIKFERLGITGGSSGGIGIKGGPIWVRYCYIYENGKGAVGDGNRGGIHGMRMMESIIEYNYFYNNSGTADHNKTHITNFADYMYDDVIDEGNPRYDWTNCRRDNEIRYNYFGSGAHTGIHDKASQYLTTFNSLGSTATCSDMTRQNNGDEIHHNLFLGQTMALFYRQDFEQIHHNIADSRIGEVGDGYPTFYKCVYNNTIIDDGLLMDMNDDLTYTSMDLAGYVVNNIVGTSTAYGAINYMSIGMAVSWYYASPCTYTYTWTDTLIDHNLSYQPTNSVHYALPNSLGSSGCRATWQSTAAFNTARSTSNFTSDASNLFAGESGANQYILYGSGSFSDGLGGATAATAGVGGNHPYLSGVTIPSYIGAVNPSDSGWVEDVLSLSTVTNLRDGVTIDLDDGEAPAASPVSNSGCAHIGCGPTGGG